jgi:hypothetical protein
MALVAADGYGRGCGGAPGRPSGVGGQRAHGTGVMHGSHADAVGGR